MAENHQNNTLASSHAEIQPQNPQPELITEEKQEIHSQPIAISPQNPHENGSKSPIEEQDLQSSKNDLQLFQDHSAKPDLQNSMQLSNRIQSHHKNNSFNLSSNQKAPSCHCKKSKCLKMYCDCFAKGNKCRETCKCIGCENTKNSNRQKKSDSRNDEEIERSQDSNKKSLKTKERSCNCKKSFCLKKYCECYNANIPCTETCKCEDCKNNGENNSYRDDKPPANLPQIDPSFFNSGVAKPTNEIITELNVINEKKEDLTSKKRQKPDEDEIQTKISQILKLVPQQNYQTMLDFLAYCLS